MSMFGTLRGKTVAVAHSAHTSTNEVESGDLTSSRNFRTEIVDAIREASPQIAHAAVSCQQEHARRVPQKVDADTLNSGAVVLETTRSGAFPVYVSLELIDEIVSEGTAISVILRSGKAIRVEMAAKELTTAFEKLKDQVFPGDLLNAAFQLKTLTGRWLNVKAITHIEYSGNSLLIALLSGRFIPVLNPSLNTFRAAVAAVYGSSTAESIKAPAPPVPQPTMIDKMKQTASDRAYMDGLRSRTRPVTQSLTVLDSANPSAIARFLDDQVISESFIWTLWAAGASPEALVRFEVEMKRVVSQITALQTYVNDLMASRNVKANCERLRSEAQLILDQLIAIPKGCSAIGRRLLQP